MIPNLKDNISSTYLQLSGRDLTAETQDTPLSINGQLLKDLLVLLQSAADKEGQSNEEHISELRLQLEQVRHNYATLQAEYDSKFAKNQVVSLNVPARRGLNVKEEDQDSIKSFRPESDDDSDDVRRREEELKAKKRQEQNHNPHVHAAGRKCCHNHSHNHLYMDTHQQHYGL